jgi:hypothetical protein
VACRYSQVPGISFKESYASVLNEVIFGMMLNKKLVWEMTCTVVDIEASFLHRDLDKGVYVEVPKGLSIGNDKKSILRMIIYGLVMRARKFHGKLINHLKYIGVYTSNSDPCL